MKRLRSFLLPTLSFAAAWAISFWVSGRHAPSAEPLPNGHSSSARRTTALIRKISAGKLTEDFLTRPASEWTGLWKKFADQADADDLRKVSRLARPGGFPHQELVQELLQSLAREELAIPGGRPVMLTPDSFSALAERDPEAGWQSLQKNNRSDLTIAALRQLAGKDPAGTLRRYLDMPASSEKTQANLDDGYLEENRARTSPTPLDSIFGAWARRDPSAAAAAINQLPPALREGAMANVAVNQAFRDGPGAIRYLLLSDRANAVVMRASFRTHPLETAELMTGSATLLKAMTDQRFQCVALGPWAEADPEGVATWSSESPNRVSSVLSLLRQNPGSCSRFIHSLAADGVTIEPSWLNDIDRLDSGLARSLADEFGIDLLADATIRERRILEEPEAACEQWLAALRKHGDPEKAMASLGWDKPTATTLAARAARVFPDKAAALAKLLPASALDSTRLWRGNNQSITRYWPELAASLEYPASPNSRPEFQEIPFYIDPATAAEKMLERPLTPDDVTRTIGLLASQDPGAARSWLAKLPDAGLCKSGELALANIEASTDPVAALNIATQQSAEGGKVDQIWQTSLTRLLVTGGDWQSWLAKMPASNAGWIGDRIKMDARVLEFARKTAEN